MFLIYTIFFICYHGILPILCTQKICTSSRNLSLFQQNTFILNSTSYLTFHNLYAIQCVQTCMKSSPCKTISFNINNGTCQLYNKPSSELQLGTDSNFVTTDIQEWPRYLAGACKNHSCPDNTICVDLKTGGYICELIGCLVPQWNTSYLVQDLPFWQFGFEVLNPCNEGFYANTTLTCQTDSHWSTFECLPYPRNCSELKKCNSSYGDGEYWLFYWDGVEYKRIKIYCHLMSTDQPKEYVTLINENFSMRSSYKYVDNTSCDVIVSSQSEIVNNSMVVTHFYKVGVVISIPRIKRGDPAFTSFVQGPFRYYGSGQDCLRPRASCPAHGVFTVDLRNTGFVMSNATQWLTSGLSLNAYIDNITWSSNNQVVRGRCGGFDGFNCGGCNVDNMHMYIEVNPDYQPDFNSAVLPVCDV